MDYERNSFHRFGDDLCRLLLSYLPLNDCFQYECVSQQWKRLIFDKQNKLIISSKESRFAIKNLVVPKSENSDNYYIINKTSLKRVLTKCRFVTHLNIDCGVRIKNDSILDIISDKCQHLKSFEVYEYMNMVSHVCLKRFASKCGQTLELLNIKCTVFLIIDMPNAMIRSTDCKTDYNDVDLGNAIESIFFSIDNSQVVPKLEEINMNDLFYFDGFESFADTYGKQIKKFIVDFKPMITSDRIQVSYISNQLNRFENLEKLHLYFGDYTIDETIESGVRLIGQKCAKLIELRIDGLDDKILKCFANNFVLLKKLEIIKCEHNIDVDLRITQCFKSSTHLTHLSLRFLNLIDQNFADIDLYLPKLTHLWFVCNNNALTDTTLRCVAKLKELRCLKLDGFFSDASNVHSITDTGICDVINSCVRIQCIEVLIKSKVSNKSLNAFVERAKQFPKVKYTYSIRSEKDSRITVDYLPNNMRLLV